MISRRFYQDLDENGKPKQRKFEIYPDSSWIQTTFERSASESMPRPTRASTPPFSTFSHLSPWKRADLQVATGTSGRI
jgi:hypothetical protein